MPNRSELQRLLSVRAFRELAQSERIEYLLTFGIHAPSTHNTQPWKFQIQGDTCTITIDNKHVVAEGDRDGRYAYISLGACVQNIVLAAENYDYLQEVAIQADGTVIITFKNKAPAEELTADARQVIQSIQTRHNYRGVFSPRGLATPEKLLDELAKLPSGIKSGVIKDADDRHELVEATAEGIYRSYSKTAFRKELAHYLNSNFSKSNVGLHGYSLGLKTLFSIIFPTLTKLKNIGAKAAKLNKRTLGSATMFMVFGVDRTTPKQFTEAGMAIERSLLLAHRQGIAASIFVAPLEFKDTKSIVKRLSGVAEPCLIIALGKGIYKKPHRHSRRIGLSDKIVV